MYELGSAQPERKWGYSGCPEDEANPLSVLLFIQHEPNYTQHPAVQTLRAQGVGFVQTDQVHAGVRGAITKTYLGSVMFELVQSEK